MLDWLHLTSSSPHGMDGCLHGMVRDVGLDRELHGGGKKIDDAIGVCATRSCFVEEWGEGNRCC